MGVLRRKKTPLPSSFLIVFIWTSSARTSFIKNIFVKISFIKNRLLKNHLLKNHLLKNCLLKNCLLKNRLQKFQSFSERSSERPYISLYLLFEVRYHSFIVSSFYFFIASARRSGGNFSIAYLREVLGISFLFAMTYSKTSCWWGLLASFSIQP